jgi:glycosyltransferase involved in cell wall biosynthesis
MGMKGFHLLHEALRLLATRVKDKSNIVLVSFGGTAGKNPMDFGFRHVEIGHVMEPLRLARLYSRADFTVVPSLLESFGQVAAESLACQTPVIAFDSSGLKDIVLHKVNGYLAAPYSTESLCEGMLWMLESDLSTLRQLGENGRQHVVETFSEEIVVEKVLRLYREHAPSSIVFQ